ncbi:MAG: hypothetical protein ACI8QZ_001220 [Chlamydiales bacterium]
MIVVQALTKAHADDAATGLALIDEVEGKIKSLTADAAYDTIAIYEAAATRGARAAVPPTKNAVVSGRRARAPVRDRTVREVRKIGRRQWKKESGYHHQDTPSRTLPSGSSRSSGGGYGLVIWKRKRLKRWRPAKS